jgi:hypothetical protein
MTQVQNKKFNVIAALIAALSVGFGSSQLTFNYSPPDEMQMIECITVIDKLVTTHNGDIKAVVQMLTANPS